MDGVIEGGWSYVWAAYGITWGVLIAYIVSLALRLKGERNDG